MKFPQKKIKFSVEKGCHFSIKYEKIPQKKYEISPEINKGNCRKKLQANPVQKYFLQKKLHYKISYIQ